MAFLFKEKKYMVLNKRGHVCIEMNKSIAWGDGREQIRPRRLANGLPCAAKARWIHIQMLGVTRKRH